MSFRTDLQIVERQVEKELGPNVSVTTSTTSFAKHDDKGFPENKVVMAVCLSVKHVSTSRNIGLNVKRDFGFGAASRNKRFKIAVTWDRMYVFGDVNRSSCFTLMLSSAQAARKLIRATMSRPIVGSLYYILEPTCTDDRRTLGTMPILETEYPVIPLKYFTNKSPLKDVLPKVSIKENISSGDQRCFVLHDVTGISLHRFTLTNEGCCMGVQCDKAYKLESKKGEHCGCVNHHGCLGNAVCQMDVTFPNPFPKDVDPSPSVSVVRFRSWRLSQLFFRDLSTYIVDVAVAGSEDGVVDNMSLRKSKNSIVEHVNKNGGWTIVGWFRKGEVTDASNETERLESETVKVHISLLTPTKQDLLESPELQALMISTGP